MSIVNSTIEIDDADWTWMRNIPEFWSMARNRVSIGSQKHFTETVYKAYEYTSLGERVRKWLNDNSEGEFHLRTVFCENDNYLEKDTIIGFSIYFMNESDRAAFLLRWADQPETEETK